MIFTRILSAPPFSYIQASSACDDCLPAPETSTRKKEPGVREEEPRGCREKCRNSGEKNFKNQLTQKRIKLPVQRAGKREHLPAPRVPEPQLHRMEALPREPRHRLLRPIDRVPADGMPNIRHVHPDLMGPPALRPGIVHRIDRDTSGLIIAAKNDAAHQALAAQLQDHSLARTYEAVVIGNLREDSGTVDAPVGRHGTDRKKMAVTDRGRNAVTHWEVLERFQGFTHIRCRLETGRTHQIRVHMAYIGHPICGDIPRSGSPRSGGAGR